MSNMTYH